MAIQVENLRWRDFWRYQRKVMRRAAFRWYYDWGYHLPYDIIGGLVAIWITGTLSWWSILIGAGGATLTGAIVYLVQVAITSALIDTMQERRLAIVSGERTEADIQRSLEARTTLYRSARMVVKRWEDLGVVLTANPDSEALHVKRLREAFDFLEERHNSLAATTAYRYSSALEEIRHLLLLDIPADQLHARLSSSIALLREVVEQEKEWDESRHGLPVDRSGEHR